MRPTYPDIQKIVALITSIFAMVASMMGGGLIGAGSNGQIIFDSDSIELRTVLREQVAITTTRQWFSMPEGDPTTASYGFALPSGATVTSFRWEVNGEWFKASLK